MRSNRSLASSGDDVISRDLPASSDTDLLYVIARDPKSLFVYWDLNWTRLFAQVGLSPQQVYLRIDREDGSIEATREINPFRGHCYVDVVTAGTSYYCELGCLNDKEWTTLIRSGKAVTPRDSISDDVSAQFATLPLHLSFQRLLDIFRGSRSGGAMLARSMAELQERARAMQGTATAAEWARLVAAASSPNGAKGISSSDVSAILQTARAAEPTVEELAKWMKLGEQLGGASWGGASGNGFGGSSPA